MDPKIIIAIVIVLVVIVGAVLLIKKNATKEPINCPVTTCPPIPVTTCPPIPAIIGKWKVVDSVNWIDSSNDVNMIIYVQNSQYFLQMIRWVPSQTSSVPSTGQTTIISAERYDVSDATLGVPTIDGNNYRFVNSTGDIYPFTLNGDFLTLALDNIRIDMRRV